MAKRIRIIFEKKEWITFVNHMDLPQVFCRAAVRAGLKLEYTRGFSPHPHMSLGPALAISVAGLAEPAEFWFDTDDFDLEKCALWNSKLPEGLKILKWAELPEGAGLAKYATAAVYRISGADEPLSSEAKEAIKEAAIAKDALLACDDDKGSLLLTVCNLQSCGASCFVRALTEKKLCGGWADLDMVREKVGTWDPEKKVLLPLV